MDAVTPKSPDHLHSADGSSLRPNRRYWRKIFAPAEEGASSNQGLTREKAPLSRSRWRFWSLCASASASAGLIASKVPGAYDLDLSFHQRLVLVAGLAGAAMATIACVRWLSVGGRVGRSRFESRDDAGGHPAAHSASGAGPNGGSRLEDGERRLDRAGKSLIRRTLGDIRRRERRLAQAIRELNRGAVADRRVGQPGRRARLSEVGARASEPVLPTNVRAALADLERRERQFVGTEAAAGRRAGAPGGLGTAVRSPRPTEAPEPAVRRHRRIQLADRRTSIVTQDGRRLNALVLDISQSGVAIEGNLPGLWIGSMVVIGRRRAKAVRSIAKGMAFEFSIPLLPDEVTSRLVL